MVKKTHGFVELSSNQTASGTPLDIDEVAMLTQFVSCDTKRAAIRKQPLIDIVNPQPKAFFAYLQMPKPANKTARIRSKRIRKVQ